MAGSFRWAECLFYCSGGEGRASRGRRSRGRMGGEALCPHEAWACLEADVCQPVPLLCRGTVGHARLEWNATGLTQNVLRIRNQTSTITMSPSTLHAIFGS